ncbi:MAG: hypothetical protein AAF559_09635 [Pseudomonadota bacterium]
MNAEIIYATIFMVCFVLLGGFVMYLSKTIDAGEARFDSETGKQLRDPAQRQGVSNPKPATRIEKTNKETDK